MGSRLSRPVNLHVRLDYRLGALRRRIFPEIGADDLLRSGELLEVQLLLVFSHAAINAGEGGIDEYIVALEVGFVITILNSIQDRLISLLAIKELFLPLLLPAEIEGKDCHGAILA